VWADTETEIDFLNYSEVAELIAELIATPDLLPLSLGVFGGWGVGKSSTLRLVEAELARTPDKYFIIKFDAWLYQDLDDARAALMAVVAGELVEAAPEGLVEKAKNLLPRINKLRALGLAIEGGAALFGVPTFGFASRGIDAIGDVFSGKADAEDVKAIEGAAADIEKKSKSLLREAPSKQPPEEIAAFRKEFGEVLTGLNRTLVVFIDNLDRCLPPNAIHTLEAVRLFLFMPKTAFVIAADEDMIRHAVSEHFRQPGERHVADYLDKLIQMPVRVPRSGVQEIRAYLFLLLAGQAVSDPAQREKLRSYLIERLQNSWRDEDSFDVEKTLDIVARKDDEPLRHSLEMADRMAPMLAHATRVQGNPRIVKRLLNVVRMRVSIARKRKMPLDEAVIAKLALFERCTDTAATEALHDAINAASLGKPELLKDIEQAGTEDEIKAKVPEGWEKHLGFVAEWAQLDPKLAGIDLRPAVYLARETVPLRLSAAAVSPKVLRAVEALLKTSTMSSRAATLAIGTLEGAERIAAMEQLISEMRKNPDWSKIRPEFRGAVLLARNSPEGRKVLGRFVRALPERPTWMNPLIKDDEWVEG
jgi:predicted KAP-like P-loop ATPase